MKSTLDFERLHEKIAVIFRGKKFCRASAEELSAGLLQAFAIEPAEVLLDFSEVKRLDIAFLFRILRIKHTLKEKGRKMVCITPGCLNKLMGNRHAHGLLGDMTKATRLEALLSL